MTHLVRVRPEAERDVEQAYEWYEERRPGLGREFLDELDVVYERIARFPLLYAEVYRGLRRAPVRRFPLGVFYFFNEKEILVVAVAHASRRARVWRSRH
jgi:toxin ParE1/3/4